MIVHMAADASIELQTAAGGSIEGDELICRDEMGRVVARAESSGVLAFGESPVLRNRVSEAEPDDSDLFRRYNKARDRYLALEAEHNEMLGKVRSGRELRALIKLQRLVDQLETAHASEFMPARTALLEDLLAEDSSS